jgi:hypothetical protein
MPAAEKCRQHLVQGMRLSRHHTFDVGAYVRGEFLWFYSRVLVIHVRSPLAFCARPKERRSTDMLTANTPTTMMMSQYCNKAEICC